MVGDYVLAVNGIDVTSIPHSEAANLARQGTFTWKSNEWCWTSVWTGSLKIKINFVILGPDVLTLTIGSDIARSPNTPRPPCRGYLHKRTQSGLIKGWRKRWFVLTHDCCLHYYKHKRVSSEALRRKLGPTKTAVNEVSLFDKLHHLHRTKAGGGRCRRSSWRGRRWVRMIPWENRSCSSAVLSLLIASTFSVPLPTRKWKGIMLCTLFLMLLLVILWKSLALLDTHGCSFVPLNFKWNLFRCIPCLHH